jgi:drug/metabolite transporter (DMT)-like permease
MVGETAALGSAVLWALSTIVIKGVTGRLSATYIMAVRTGIATLLALVLLLVAGQAETALDLPAGTAVLLVATAPLAIAGDLCFVRALALADVSRVFTLSTSLYILFSVAGGMAFTGDDFSWFLPIGGATILIGTRWVLEERPTEQVAGGGGAPTRTRQKTLTSVIWLTLAAAVLWSSGLLVLTEALEGTDPLVAVTVRLPVMALSMVVLAVFRGDYARFGLAIDNLSVLGLSGCLALVSMFCFLLAADQSGAGTVAVLSSTSPIFVPLLAFVFLGERVTKRVAAGTALCVAGIWLAVL